MSHAKQVLLPQSILDKNAICISCMILRTTDNSIIAQFVNILTKDGVGGGDLGSLFPHVVKNSEITPKQSVCGVNQFSL